MSDGGVITLDGLLEFSKKMDRMTRLMVEILDRMDEWDERWATEVEPSWSGSNVPRRELNTKQAAEYLNMSPTTLYHMVAKGLVPHHRTKTGGRLVFVEAELCEYKNTRGVQKVHTKYDDEREAREYLLRHPGPKLPTYNGARP